MHGPALATAEPAVATYLAGVKQRTAELATQLHEMLAQEELVLGELTEQLALSRARRDRLVKTLAALTAESPPPKTERPVVPKKKPGDWQVSDRKVEEVFARLRALGGGPMTPAALARETPGLSPESAKRALVVLRGREQVRVTGRARGGGTLYALMPTAAELVHAA